MNHLEKIPSGVDDLIAKFVHEPKYQFELRFVYYDTSKITDSDDPSVPYTNQRISEGYFIILGRIEVAKGLKIELNEDFAKTSKCQNFFDGEKGLITSGPNYTFLKRKGNIVEMKIRDCSRLIFDLNDHYQWIKALVDLIEFIVNKHAEK